MKTYFVVVIAIIVGAVWYGLEPGEAGNMWRSFTEKHSATPTPPSPVYGWESVRSETVVLQPGEAWRFGPIPFTKLTETAKIRVRMNSTVPVIYGFMPANWDDSLNENPRILMVPENIQKLICGGTATLQIDRTCTVDASDGDRVFVALDPRGGNAGDALLALGLAWVGSKDRLNDMTATNKFSINIEGWGCIQNCPADDVGKQNQSQNQSPEH